MDTQLLPMADSASLVVAQKLLVEGHVIAGPTDTIYGLFCRFDSERAIERVYEAKDRPPRKALPLLIGAVEQLEHLVQKPLPAIAQPLIKQFWPGPLTLILPALSTLPAILTGGQPTIAVRLPAHERLRALLCETGPLTGTSANLSGYADTLSAGDVSAQLKGRIPLILDGGPSIHTTGSTLVNLSAPSGQAAQILRHGPIGDEVAAWLEAAL